VDVVTYIRHGSRRIKCLGSRRRTDAIRIPRPNARKKRGKTRSDDLHLHLRIHSEGIPSSKIAICHGGPVVQEIHIHTSRRRIAYDVLICQRLGHLCSRRAGSGPKASRVLRISRHSAEGEHPRGPEGSRIGGICGLQAVSYCFSVPGNPGAIEVVEHPDKAFLICALFVIDLVAHQHGY
jgi:hypothetical protein